MKISRKRQLLLLVLVTLFYWGSPTRAGTIENYSFINSMDDRDHYKSFSELVELREFSNEALKEKGMPLEDENTLVISFDRVAIWLEPQADWSSEIDRSDRVQRESLNTLDEKAKQVALYKAFSAVNLQTNSGLSQATIEELVRSVSEDFQTLLSSTDGYMPLEPRKRDRFPGRASHCIVSSYYIRFNRESLFDFIQPSPVTLDLVVPKLGTDDFISKDTIPFHCGKFCVAAGSSEASPAYTEKLSTKLLINFRF